MASVTVTLVNGWYGNSNNGVNYAPGTSPIIPATAGIVGASRYLSYMQLPKTGGATNQVYLYINDSSSSIGGSDPGEDFYSNFEQNGVIILSASDGESVTMSLGDSTEPYIWTPSNLAEVRSFSDHVIGLGSGSRAITVTFDDNPTVAPSFADNTGDAQDWVQNVAIASTTVPAAVGTPTPTYAAVGSLPAGIAFNTLTRVISGTPTGTGSGTITIRATNSQGTADWTVAYTTAATVPAQPTGLAATATHDTVSLTWDDPNDASITSYQILRRDITGGGSLGVHVDSVPAGTSYDDTTNVDASNTYSYRIKARNAQGLSAQSAFLNATTSATPSVDHTVFLRVGGAYVEHEVYERVSGAYVLTEPYERVSGVYVAIDGS